MTTRRLIRVVEAVSFAELVRMSEGNTGELGGDPVADHFKFPDNCIQG